MRDIMSLFEEFYEPTRDMKRAPVLLKLDEKLFSYDVIRGNRFTDIVFVTAVKTGHSVKVYFDFLSNKVSFIRH